MMLIQLHPLDELLPSRNGQKCYRDLRGCNGDEIADLEPVLRRIRKLHKPIQFEASY